MRQPSILWLVAAILGLISNTALAQSPEPLALEVDLETGRMRILASPDESLRVNSYSILSPSGSLRPGNATGGMQIAGDYDGRGLVEQGDLDLVLLHWGEPTPPPPDGWTNDLPVGPIDQAELDGVLLNWGKQGGEGWLGGNLSARDVDRVGSGQGEGWEVLVASEHHLYEAFLFGESLFEADRVEPIGDAFDASVGVQDVEFFYSTVGGVETPGFVVYVANTSATAAALPEPSAAVLLLVAASAFGLVARIGSRRQLFILAAMGYSAANDAVASIAANPVSTHGEATMKSAAELALAAAAPEEATREAAVAALEDLGPPKVAEIAALAELLANADSDAAYWAATLIGRAGKDASPVTPNLQATLASRTESHVRERIVWALGKIGPPAAAASSAVETLAAMPDCTPRLARLCRQALQSMQASP